MLNVVNKYILLFLVLLIIVACNEARKSNEQILTVSQNLMGKEYNMIFEQALDSLRRVEESKLKGFEWAWLLDYQLDSTLCFNIDKNRMIAAILVQCNQPNCQTDEVQYLYGAKIKDKWYFFGGGGHDGYPT